MPRFACPECRLALSPRADGEFPCARCNAAFRERAGIFRFVSSERASERSVFVEQYRQVRGADGCRIASAAYCRALPRVAAGDPRAAEWRIRARGAAVLLRALARGGTRSSRVLDLGAGNGWLSNCLARQGHAAVAVDLLDDEADGLGAWKEYDTSFCAVQADFEALPFEPAQFDAVVFNASLHYAADPGAALAGAHRMLREGGMIAVLDSPMFVHAADGERMAERQREAMRARAGLPALAQTGRGFVTFADLDRAAARLRLRARFARSRGPLGWELRRALARPRIGRAPATFGAWIAR